MDYIKTVNVNQLASGKTVLSIPYIPQQHRDDGAYYNSELEKLHLGTRRLNFAGNISEITISIHQKDLGYQIKGIEQVELKLPGKDHFYKFGSYAIIESMAYEIDRLSILMCWQNRKIFVTRQLQKLSVFAFRLAEDVAWVHYHR